MVWFLINHKDKFNIIFIYFYAYLPEIKTNLKQNFLWLTD
jgi:hypothetical protein